MVFNLLIEEKYSIHRRMSLSLFGGEGFSENRDQLLLVNSAFPSLGLPVLRGFFDVLDTFPGLYGSGIFLTYFS